MKIFGVEILNKGNGVSIDDAVSEMRATFLRDAQDRYLFLPQVTGYTGLDGPKPLHQNAASVL